MEALLLEILELLRDADSLPDKRLAQVIHKHNKVLESDRRHFAKKMLLPYYLTIKEQDTERWLSWQIDEALEKRLFRTLQIKPRRTASGVSTITVITKPWRCSSNCLYCPNDLRMPKSYLSDEPACQRAERNYFDPYLQLVSRLRALTHMGHSTDKVELIILGGTWNDYPEEYQIWFVAELFRALNDASNKDVLEKQTATRQRFYRDKGLSDQSVAAAAFVKDLQQRVFEGTITYNQASRQLYEDGQPWSSISHEQTAALDELFEQHTINETAQHRVVGLVIETRPDAINIESLTMLRRLGCTKVQMGTQSLDPTLLALNGRGISIEKIREAFSLLRLFGFKIHVHFMVNLYGAHPENDKQDYLRLVTEEPYQPDEVKIYPCALVAGTDLCTYYEQGTWQPYSEEELLDVLVTDLLNTPPFIRISRMIRDISAGDILVGNKKTNFRQMVENKTRETGVPVSEIRYREISTSKIEHEELDLDVLTYKTSVTTEYFLQWITAENKIVGFLRLSLPDLSRLSEELFFYHALPVAPNEAMIREVHVYGTAARLHGKAENAQHLGLGKQLIEAACAIAQEQGYRKVKVISSVGTREYYQNLGFTDTKNGLYQILPL